MAAPKAAIHARTSTSHEIADTTAQPKAPTMRTLDLMPKILVITLLFTPSLGQKFTLGSCPVVNTIPGYGYNNDLVLAANNPWRLFATSPSIYFHGWNCITYGFVRLVANIQYAMTIRGFQKITNAAQSINADLTVRSTTATPTGTTTINDIFTFTIPIKRNAMTANYVLLNAVAGAFLVFYSCENLGLGKLENVLVLVTPATTPAQVTTAIQTVTEAGYPSHALKFAYQGCIN